MPDGNDAMIKNITSIIDSLRKEGNRNSVSTNGTVSPGARDSGEDGGRERNSANTPGADSMAEARFLYRQEDDGRRRSLDLGKKGYRGLPGGARSPTTPLSPMAVAPEGWPAAGSEEVVDGMGTRWEGWLQAATRAYTGMSPFAEDGNLAGVSTRQEFSGSPNDSPEILPVSGHDRRKTPPVMQRETFIFV